MREKPVLLKFHKDAIPPFVKIYEPVAPSNNGLFNHVSNVVKKTQRGLTKDYFAKISICDYTTSVEVIAGEICRRICGVDFMPKTRVGIMNTSEGQRSFVLSKAIPGFLSFDGFLELAPERQQAYVFTPRDLAKLHVSQVCTQDPDLHDQNWGFNISKTVCRIDTGAAYSSIFSQDDYEPSPFQLTIRSEWINLIYPGSEYFSTITSDDIKAMPNFINIKAYNTPLISLGEKDKNQKRDLLSENSEYIKWKFFYFTLFFILHTNSDIDILFKAHSIYLDEENQRFKHIIIKHREILKIAFFEMQEYINFLNNTMPILMPDLEEEINKYNQGYQTKSGETKLQKQEFLIDINEVHKTLNDLKIEAEKTNLQNTDEVLIARKIETNIRIINRDLTALKKLKEIILKPQIDLNSILVEIEQAALPLSSLETIFPGIQSWLLENIGLPDAHSAFFSCNPNATIGEFSSYLQELHSSAIEKLKIQSELLLASTKELFKSTSDLYCKNTGNLFLDKSIQNKLFDIEIELDTGEPKSSATCSASFFRKPTHDLIGTSPKVLMAIRPHSAP